MLLGLTDINPQGWVYCRYSNCLLNEQRIIEELAAKESVKSGEVPKAEWLPFWGVVGVECQSRGEFHILYLETMASSDFEFAM